MKRATPGKALEFSFGASIHRVIGLDISDPVFEPNTAEVRPLWRPRVDLLLGELRKGPAVLRLSYLADVEEPRDRIEGPETDVAFTIDNAVVVLVDDVLSTGRTVRVALDVLAGLGRPRAIQVAVLIDRGNREVPIRADFVGQNVSGDEPRRVHVRVRELDGRDEVALV